MNFFEVVNVYGMIFAALLVLPHIFFIKTRKYDKSVFTNRAMVYIDRIGRFFGVFLMSVNIGVLEKGFPEPKEKMRLFWLITTAVMVAFYLVMWLLFMRRGKKLYAYLIIFSSAAVVIFSGICQVKTLLFTAGIVYLAGELYMAAVYFKSNNT